MRCSALKPMHSMRPTSGVTKLRLARPPLGFPPNLLTSVSWPLR